MNLFQCTWSRWWGAWGWSLLFHIPYGYYEEGPKKGKHRNDLLGLHKAHDIGDQGKDWRAERTNKILWGKWHIHIFF